MSQLDSKPSTQQSSTVDGLARGKLGVWGIVFFVVSAAAPLSVIVSGAPLSVRLGGIGAPGAIVVCGVVLILFACGFTAMSQHVRNTGAFYAYASKGLGKATGVGLALTTTVSYALLLIGFYGFLGYFAAETMVGLFGLDVPWGVCALLAATFVCILGYRQIDVGAKVLAVLLAAEIAILLALSIAVLIKGGPEAPSILPFMPEHVFFAAGAGSLFVLGFGSYIGFEGTAIYSEEARHPRRTVPMATYLAIGFLAAFYGFTYWIFIQAFGVKSVMTVVLSDNFGEAVFDAGRIYLGSEAVIVMRLLIITSFLACIIAFHNGCARYLFALSREGLLPRLLARTHPISHSPFVASNLLTFAVAASTSLTIALGADPYLQLGTWTYAAGVVGIVFAQAVCALAVTVFFIRDRHGYSIFRVVVAPALGSVGLAVGVALIVANFPVVTGSTGVLNWLLLLPTPLLFVLGIGYALCIKRMDAQRYQALAENNIREPST